MHYHQHMGYPITYHQRIAIPIHFIHSGTLFHIQFFNPQHIKNLTSPTPAKKLLPSVANTFRGRANALFIGFLGIHSSILILPWEGISSPKEAPGNAKAAFPGASALFKSFKMGILWCCQVVATPLKGRAESQCLSGLPAFYNFT